MKPNDLNKPTVEHRRALSTYRGRLRQGNQTKQGSRNDQSRLTNTTMQVMLSPPMPVVLRGSSDKQLSMTSSQIADSDFFPTRSRTKLTHLKTERHLQPRGGGAEKTMELRHEVRYVVPNLDYSVTETKIIPSGV